MKRVLFALALTVFSAAVCFASAPVYHMTTDMSPTGQKVSSIAVEYDKDLKQSLLSNATFDVMVDIDGSGKYEAIPVVRTYVDGKSAVVELDQWSPNASTNFYNGRITLPRNYYKVTQKKPLAYADGSIQQPSDTMIPQKSRKNILVDDFKAMKYESPKGGELNYRLFEPNMDETNQKVPLILFCHGGGEVGSSNLTQIVANVGATVWTTPEMQKKYPAYVVAPQVPEVRNAEGVRLVNWTDPDVERMTIELIDKLVAEKKIDPKRIYVQGMSMGGQGTWNFITKHPDKFAAAVAICGRAKPEDMPAVQKMPIRVFHAVDDPTVPVTESQNAVEALKKLGSDVVYVEYPEGYAGIFTANPHHSWEAVYYDQGLLDWLFTNSK